MSYLLHRDSIHTITKENKIKLQDYQAIKAEPSKDWALYNIFNLSNFEEGFNKATANANKKIIIREFHPDRKPASESAKYGQITASINKAWEIIGNPNLELVYRLWGRSATSRLYNGIIEWEELEDIDPRANSFWDQYEKDHPPQPKQKEELEIINLTEEESKESEKEDKNPAPESRPTPENSPGPESCPSDKEDEAIAKILDHSKKHGQYLAKCIMKNGFTRNLPLYQTKDSPRALMRYLEHVAEVHPKKMPYLQKNHQSLFDPK